MITLCNSFEKSSITNLGYSYKSAWQRHCSTNNPVVLTNLHSEIDQLA